MLRQRPNWSLPLKSTGFSRICTGLTVLLGCVFLSACSSLNPFDDFEAPTLPAVPNLSKVFSSPEKKLPGKRVPVMTAKGTETALVQTAAVAGPLNLPNAALNPVWSQPGGVPSNAPGHLSLQGGLRTVWTASIGKGSTSKGKLTVSPIIYDGKVFTLDTRGNLRAYSINGGRRIWGVSLTPKNEKDHEGFGGGLAANGGRLFAATGYGTIVAINPANGSAVWTKNLGVPVRSSPTASADKVFVVTTEGRLYCLAAVDGQELWSYRGFAESAALLTNVSPAISGETVVVPYPSGDVVAFNINSGKPIWAESLTRRRISSSLASLTNPARPAIYQGQVYAVGHAGRMVATSLANGERLWNQNIQGVQTPWVSGDTVFVVDVNAKLMALRRSDGQARWIVQLPGKGSWNGPVLAGGKLWLVSSTGHLVGVDAASGKIAGKKDLGSKFFIAPIVANGRMYVLNDRAKLIALN